MSYLGANHEFGRSIAPAHVEPVILDLAGTGIKITQLTSSNMYFDMVGDGLQHRTAWAGAGNGVLVLDLTDSNQVTQRNQIVFTDWDPSASSDLEAIKDIFDTNHNGKLDAGDAKFAKFMVLVTNPDGTSTLTTLAGIGVASIELTPNATSIALRESSSVNHQTIIICKEDRLCWKVSGVTLSHPSARCFP